MGGNSLSQTTVALGGLVITNEYAILLQRLQKLTCLRSEKTYCCLHIMISGRWILNYDYFSAVLSAS